MIPVVLMISMIPMVLMIPLIPLIPLIPVVLMILLILVISMILMISVIPMIPVIHHFLSIPFPILFCKETCICPANGTLLYLSWFCFPHDAEEASLTPYPITARKHRFNSPQSRLWSSGKRFTISRCLCSSSSIYRRITGM